ARPAAAGRPSARGADRHALPREGPAPAVRIGLGARPRLPHRPARLGHHRDPRALAAGDLADDAADDPGPGPRLHPADDPGDGPGLGSGGDAGDGPERLLLAATGPRPAAAARL